MTLVETDGPVFKTHEWAIMFVSFLRALFKQHDSVAVYV